MAEAARPRVVITRPRDESVALARRLESLGYAALIEPMLEIVSLAVAIPPLDRYAALAFTSANGARAFAGLSSARDIPAYAVGAATAAALVTAGFVDVRTGSSDAAGLARLAASQLPPAARLLHASGTAIARDLEDLLAADRILVDRLAVYEAFPVKSFSETFVAALYACTIEFVLFFSARTAEVFGTLASQMALTDACRPIAALCLSPAVAERAATTPWSCVTVAAEPTEESVLALLPARGIDG